jgi:hypothetical protein
LKGVGVLQVYTMTKKERSELPNTMPLPRKVLSCTTWLRKEYYVEKKVAD